MRGKRSEARTAVRSYVASGASVFKQHILPLSHLEKQEKQRTCRLPERRSHDEIGDRLFTDNTTLA